MKTRYRYVHFRECVLGKPHSWTCCSKVYAGILLGEIVWYKSCGWQFQSEFYVVGEEGMNTAKRFFGVCLDCTHLRDIADFMAQLKKEVSK